MRVACTGLPTCIRTAMLHVSAGVVVLLVGHVRAGVEVRTGSRNRRKLVRLERRCFLIIGIALHRIPPRPASAAAATVSAAAVGLGANDGRRWRRLAHKLVRQVYRAVSSLDQILLLDVGGKRQGWTVVFCLALGMACATQIAKRGTTDTRRTSDLFLCRIHILASIATGPLVASSDGFSRMYIIHLVLTES